MHNLTKSQQDALRWIVQKIREGSLDEEFSCVFLVNGKFGRFEGKGADIVEQPPITEGILNALMASDLITVNKKEKYLVHCTLLRKSYQVVDSKEQATKIEKPSSISKKGLLGISFFIISIITIIVFLFSYFIQPILPPDTNYALLLIVASLAGVMSFLAALNEIIELFQKFFGTRGKGGEHSRDIDGVNDDALCIYFHKNPPYNAVKMLYVGSEIAKDLCVTISFINKDGATQSKMVTEFFPKEDPKMMWHHYKYDFLEPNQVVYFHLLKSQSTSDSKATVTASFTGAKSGKSIRVEKSFDLYVY